MPAKARNDGILVRSSKTIMAKGSSEVSVEHKAVFSNGSSVSHPRDCGRTDIWSPRISEQTV